MRDTKSESISAIQAATRLKLAEQGPIAERIQRMMDGELPQGEQLLRGDLAPDIPISYFSDNKIAWRWLNKYYEVVDAIPDMDIRNAVLGHMLVADQLQILQAIESYLVASGGYNEEVAIAFDLLALDQLAQHIASQSQQPSST